MPPKGFKHSPETRQRLSEVMTAYHAATTPEVQRRTQARRTLTLKRKAGRLPGRFTKWNHGDEFLDDDMTEYET
jgi:hypothetical protein